MTARDDDTRRAVAPRLTTTPAIPVATPRHREHANADP